jgi:hypothetical protein
MLDFLKQPYPFEPNPKKQLLQNALIGAFIAFFLIFFQPFDTNLWQDEYKILKLAGYGLVTFLMPTALFLILHWFFSADALDRGHNVWREFLGFLMTVTSIAFGNLCYSTALGLGKFSFSTFIGFLIAVMALGVFPIVFGIVLKYNRYKAMNEKGAADLSENLQQYNEKHSSGNNQISESDETIQLIAENEKDTISLKINELLYIETADNYSNIVFFRNNKVQKELLRGPLKRFENQLPFPLIQRCHRSFIVNLQHVADIKGNAQGYRISLHNSDAIVPVARNYGAIILEKLKN